MVFVTFSINSRKRKDCCDLSYPDEKAYKLEESPDKESEASFPVNQGNTLGYDERLSIPTNDTIRRISIGEIFSNQETLINIFTQIIHYRNKPKLDLSTSGLLLRSEARIVQLTKERFGPQAEKHLLQLSKRIDLKFRYKLSAIFPTQFGVNDSFRVIKNGAWFLCSYSEVFKSEEAFKEYVKDLFKYIERTPKELEKERAKVSLKSLLERFTAMKESDEKERIIDFVYDFSQKMNLMILG